MHLYKSTNQGAKTRSLLLSALNPGEELSREELSQRAGLSYIQIRRQAQNLCIEGLLQSRSEGRKRLYKRVVDA